MYLSVRLIQIKNTPSLCLFVFFFVHVHVHSLIMSGVSHIYIYSHIYVHVFCRFFIFLYIWQVLRGSVAIAKRSSFFDEVRLAGFPKSYVSYIVCRYFIFF